MPPAMEGREIASRRRSAAFLRVEGMTCGKCSSTVETALKNLDGVHDASVNCITNLARVEFDPDIISVEALVEGVDDVGFAAALSEMQDLSGPSKEKQKPKLSVELKVRGMTCAYCSGTVERHLQSLAGVERATVSLILHRAFVVCDPSRLTPEALQEEIEDVGFEAEVDIVDSGEAQMGRASLHVQVLCRKPGGPEIDLLAFCRCARGLLGVLGCQVTLAGYLHVVYDPHVAGARKLLQKLTEAFGEEVEVQPVLASAENEQLQGHMNEIRSLGHDLRFAVPPAVSVFVLTIVLPSVGFDQDHLGFLSWHLHHGVDVFAMAILCLATPVQFITGYRFHAAAYRALKRRAPNMDVLVSVATNTSYFYSTGLILFCLLSPETPGSHDLSSATSHFFTMGPILIAVVLLGKFLEANAKLTAMRALTDLPSSMPAMAVLCGSEGEVPIRVELVELGDVLRVHAGSKIAVDGTVCSEASFFVDESLLTGESVAIEKRRGDVVIGGTTCVSVGCLMRVTKVGCETALGQMAQLVLEAQASKAGVQRAADQVARVFVPSVICLAFATFAVWAVLVFTHCVDVPRTDHHGFSHMMDMSEAMRLGEDVDPQGSLKLLFAMKFGMAVLMIACPCAMGLATPMAVMVATGVAAKRGCLVKSAAALETSARLDAVVLDKTGTITEGAPSIQAAACIVGAIEALSRSWSLAKKFEFSEASTCSRGRVPVKAFGEVVACGSLSERQEACFWWLLGTLESASDHPVAKCIQRAVQQVEGLPPIIAPRDFEYIGGRGVRCVVEQLGGASAGVGNVSFFTETVQQVNGGTLPTLDPPGVAELLHWVRDLQEQGHTVVLLHADARLVGAVAVRDPVREDAEWVVDYLQRRLGLEVWICSGDNAATTGSIAREVGIHNVVAEALPGQKAETVLKIQRQGAGRRPRRICFIGDGMNDSPALAQADVGIAIGVGAQVAVEAADVTLVRSELSDVVTFLALSKATFNTIILNFFWAFCFNVVCLPMAAGVFYPRIHIPPLVAGIGMASSSCLVVLSSLQLRSFGPPVRDRKKAKRYHKLGLSLDPPEGEHHSPGETEPLTPPSERVEPQPQAYGNVMTEEL